MSRFEVLMVEDSPSDVLLAREALLNAGLEVHLAVVEDGVAALDYLHKARTGGEVPVPDLVLLDLNLPRMNGREVLAEIRADARLTHLPVVVLTTSRSDEDVIQAYKLHANCYVTKPMRFAGFAEVIRAIRSFWFTIATLPHEGPT